MSADEYRAISWRSFRRHCGDRLALSAGYYICRAIMHTNMKCKYARDCPLWRRYRHLTYVYRDEVHIEVKA